MLYSTILLVIEQPHLKDTNAVNNVAELLMKGGFIMIPILLLSIFSIYLFIERFLYIRKNAFVDQELIYNIPDAIRNKRNEDALVLARNNDTSIGRILASGLSQPGKTPVDVEKYMEATANIEISEMEKNTGYLGIIAGIAPMLGFIGTISGVIKIFYNISLADNISIGIIAGGLYQKMICSGAGLIVGVISYAAYHILQLKIDRYTITLQENLLYFINKL